MVSALEFEFTSCPSCYADEFPWHTSQRLAAEIDDDAEVLTMVMPLMMIMMMMKRRNEGDDTDDGADIDGEGDDSQVAHPAQNN